MPVSYDSGSNPRPEKRGGAGGHNWGTAKDELAATAEEGAPPAGGDEEAAEVPDNSLTLEEYMAAAAGKGKTTLPAARKAGEGEKGAKRKESQKVCRLRAVGAFFFFRESSVAEWPRG